MVRRSQLSFQRGYRTPCATSVLTAERRTVMSTPATVHQASKFVRDALGDPDSDQMQYLLANSGLFKELARADFSRIDRAAFTALLTATSAANAWRSVEEYADKIAARSKLRDWGLTKAQINSLAANLVDHAGPLQPTGISLWLGRDLAYNWAEAMAWLHDEVTALGEKFTPYVGAGRVSFFSGRRQIGGRKLTVALLDLQTYWDPTDGVVLNEVRKSGKRLPGLEVAWLLALNPQVYAGIDYETIPGFIAAGLVVGSDSVPVFGRDSDGAFVLDYWSDGRWGDLSVVASRE